MTSAPTLYDLAGGMPFFVALVDRFYDGVAADAQLCQIYPEPDDLTGARHRLTLFLAQYWGGPTTYDTERGHPRLRMRHAPFAIGPAERDRWLAHMAEAVAYLGPPPRRRRAPRRLLRHRCRGDAEPGLSAATGIVG